MSDLDLKQCEPSSKRFRMVRAGRGTFLLSLLQAVWLVSGLSQPAVPTDFSAAHQRMVEEQLAAPGRGIKNRLVLEAMSTVPRHEFVPESVRKFAYRDEPLPPRCSTG